PPGHPRSPTSPAKIVDGAGQGGREGLAASHHRHALRPRKAVHNGALALAIALWGLFGSMIAGWAVLLRSSLGAGGSGPAKGQSRLTRARRVASGSPMPAPQLVEPGRARAPARSLSVAAGSWSGGGTLAGPPTRAPR